MANQPSGARRLKLIPYIGCKSGFSHVFDSLVPDDPGRVYDVFGGGGGFSFYACDRFGSENVEYNDHNPVICNLMKVLKKDPQGLHEEYQGHSKRSSPEYFLEVRRGDLEDGTEGAGRFFYLAKTAFSGKIRFNTKNRFNSPMRKDAGCPMVELDSLLSLSRLIRRMKITNKDYEELGDIKGGFVYLDPPYLNNPNGHDNATVDAGRFLDF